MRKMLLGLLVALALPAAALATKPPHPNHPNTPAPKVTYVLKGTLSAYTAANGNTPGSITIAVSAGNKYGKAFKGQTLVFAVSSSTHVVLHKGAAIANGDRGSVKARGAKGLNATALQALGAQWVIDQGPAH